MNDGAGPRTYRATLWTDNMYFVVVVLRMMCR
jgi:hypothetical protein